MKAEFLSKPITCVKFRLLWIDSIDEIMRGWNVRAQGGALLYLEPTCSKDLARMNHSRRGLPSGIHCQLSIKGQPLCLHGVSKEHVSSTIIHSHCLLFLLHMYYHDQLSQCIGGNIRTHRQFQATIELLTRKLSLRQTAQHSQVS